LPCGISVARRAICACSFFRLRVFRDLAEGIAEEARASAVDRNDQRRPFLIQQTQQLRKSRLSPVQLVFYFQLKRKQFPGGGTGKNYHSLFFRPAVGQKLFGPAHLFVELFFIG
jgi:hypothetical protein